MDIECEHAFITDKKISPFASVVTKIFDFFFVSLLLGHPGIHIISTNDYIYKKHAFMLTVIINIQIIPTIEVQCDKILISNRL